MHRTEQILEALKSLSYKELQELWGCNDEIALQNYKRLENMDLKKDLIPTVLAYEGIAFQYMAPSVFDLDQLYYVQEHLRILSAFYGLLKPMDGVTPYRLEMQAKLRVGAYKTLYEFWGKDLYKELRDESGIIINLASKEYSKCIEKYLTPSDKYISCEFSEYAGGKLKTKATYAKMARGEMVRFMAENRIEDPEGLKTFNRLGYKYSKDHSDQLNYVFIKE